MRREYYYDNGKQAPWSYLKCHDSIATKPRYTKAETNIVCDEELAIPHRVLGEQNTEKKFG